MHLDLNLLTALDALLEEGSVTGAADRLYLSQPAMSRTLGRIRALTGDQILVRTGRTMTATPYAMTVREQVHLLVRDAEAVLSPDHRLDLATLQRTFTIQGHDALITSMAPALLQALPRDAPGVVLRFLAEGPADTSDLRQGRVDLELGASEPTRPEIRHEVLGAGQLQVVLRANHPLLSGRLTTRRYAAAEHVVVTRRGRLHDHVDDALRAQGHRRRVIAAVPTIAAALLIVHASDAITTIAAETATPLMAGLGLQTRRVPVRLPPLVAISAWHQRYNTDPAHQWLRALVRQTFGQAGARAPSP
ncbi:LysR family transcriptional regulator [uncultured Jatrophihabitans sp.]|uniref:LysR family transcriptional regulator n=1 Tax=uncultured Jatrophihabitans sp. TaxID=1610747 RepID=UPI0035CC45DD